MTRLSVNVNKIATLRNARGGNVPDLVRMALDIERFGAMGITVHPRPDERHITYKDVMDLSAVVTTEFNIEGYPDDRYLEIIEKTRPAQATLVPDPPHVLTSNAGWDTRKNLDFLKETVSVIKSWGVRVSIFLDPEVSLVPFAAKTGTDRIELYTEMYARGYHANKHAAISPYVETALAATQNGLGINAGHDLDLHNLAWFASKLPALEEVSIGHALISDALIYGMENTVQLYLRQLSPPKQ